MDDLELVKDKLSDREWRLNNLYFIKDKDGRKVSFKFNTVQKMLHDSLWFRNVIPKARKTGVSTFFCILALDQILFSENRTAGIIAHRQEDVKRLFRNNILFALEHLPPWLKTIVGDPDISSANELVFKNGGSIFVSLTTRGQTPQFLHVSEMGYICKYTPDRADEIISGAVNSVALGNFVSFESTAEGKVGHFYDMCMRAEKLRLANTKLTPLDFRIHFFPWYLDPQYELHDADFVTISPEYMEYFNKLEKDLGIHLSIEKRRWYVKSKETNQEHMFSQFPSTLEEAFSTSMEGAYYGKLVNAVYAEKRLGFFPIDPSYPVNTAWDLGMDDSTAICFYQTIGPEIRFVDFYEASNVGLDVHVAALRSKGYRYGKHTLPHDVNVRELSTGSTRLEMLYSLGLSSVEVAPKLTRIDGIEKVRLLFPRFRFDKQKAGALLDYLSAYTKKWDAGKGVWSDVPAHGPESHGADAVRYLAVMYMETYGSTKLYDDWGDPITESGIHIESMW